MSISSNCSPDWLFLVNGVSKRLQDKNSLQLHCSTWIIQKIWYSLVAHWKFKSLITLDKGKQKLPRKFRGITHKQRQKEKERKRKWLPLMFGSKQSALKIVATNVGLVSLKITVYPSSFFFFFLGGKSSSW